MKLGQNVCLVDISDKFDIGSVWVSIKVNKSNIRKYFCTLQRLHFQSHTIETFSEFETGSSKTRSLGQNVETTCLCFLGHMFSTTFMKLDQNVMIVLK